MAWKGGAKWQCLKYCRFSRQPIRLMKVYCEAETVFPPSRAVEFMVWMESLFHEDAFIDEITFDEKSFIDYLLKFLDGLYCCFPATSIDTNWFLF